MSELRREIEFTPAYDRRAEGYGIHGVEMRMLVHGPKGAIQFVLFTNWFLPETVERLKKTHAANSLFEPMPADLGYHSLTPMYEEQSIFLESCPYLGGKPCYYDGSGLNAEIPFNILRKQGGDAVWEYLEDYYRSRFKE